MTDDFNPDDLNEIAARFEQAEREETTSVVCYIELPYTTAANIAKMGADYDAGNFWSGCVPTLLEFAAHFAANVARTIEEDNDED